jgi:hypothetical protein
MGMKPTEIAVLFATDSLGCAFKRKKGIEIVYGQILMSIVSIFLVFWDSLRREVTYQVPCVNGHKPIIDLTT